MINAISDHLSGLITSQNGRPVIRDRARDKDDTSDTSKHEAPQRVIEHAQDEAGDRRIEFDPADVLGHHHGTTQAPGEQQRYKGREVKVIMNLHQLRRPDSFPELAKACDPPQRQGQTQVALTEIDSGGRLDPQAPDAEGDFLRSASRHPGNLNALIGKTLSQSSRHDFDTASVCRIEGADL